MASPFHEAPGIHKLGDIKFEWRSLLNTPCYGFNGPNACYSSTCAHNPSLSEPEKQLTKSKSSMSSKSMLKSNYNGRKMFGGERAVDYNASKSSLTSHLTVQMNAVAYNHMYSDFEYTFDGGDYHFDGKYTPNRQLCDEISLQEIKDFNLIFPLPSYYCHPPISSSPNTVGSQSDESSFESINLPNENVVSTKKHAFNPLSEPFHPTSKICCNTSSPDSFSSDLSENNIIESIQIESIDAEETTTTTKAILPWHQESPNEFICILCPEKFNTLDELNDHIKNKVFLPHICVICGVSFAHDYLLQRHLKSHRSLKTFNCRGCHKKFRSLNQLRKHYELCRYKLYIFI